MRWQLIAPGASVTEASYKGDDPERRARRERMLSALASQTSGWLRCAEGFLDACEDDDDQIDALISALVALALDQGWTDEIPRGLGWLAAREGWIHLPRADFLTA